MDGWRNRCWLRIKNQVPLRAGLFGRLRAMLVAASVKWKLSSLEPEPPNTDAEKYQREPKQNAYFG